jgi:hypothetical protein
VERAVAALGQALAVRVAVLAALALVAVAQEAVERAVAAREVAALVR